MYAATLPREGAIQVRLALALVLLEHQPANLSLQDWLDSLRTLVKQRTVSETSDTAAKSTAASVATTVKPTSDSSREARTTSDRVKLGHETVQEPQRGGPDRRGGSNGPRADSREERASDVARIADVVPQSTQLRLAASNLGPPAIGAFEALVYASRAPCEPSQASDLSVSSATSRFLVALEASLSSEELVKANATELAVKFDALGIVGKWFVELVVKWRTKRRDSESDAGYGTRSKKKTTDRSEVVASAEEVIEQADAALEPLANLLSDSIPLAISNPIALGNLAALLIQLAASTSQTTRLAQARILPALLQHLVPALQSLVLPSALEPGENTGANSMDSNASERISAILSLAHLVLDASPPDQDSHERARSSEELRRALDALVRLLGTHGVDAQLAEVQLPFSAMTGADTATSVESAVGGLVERIWEQVDEPAEDETRG